MSKQEINERCVGCTYWRPIAPTAVSSIKCCHHLLDTGKRREVDGDICLSRKEGKHVRRAHPFDVPLAQL